MKITKHGFIKGGVCEKRLDACYNRSIGSWAACRSYWIVFTNDSSRPKKRIR